MLYLYNIDEEDNIDDLSSDTSSSETVENEQTTDVETQSTNDDSNEASTPEESNESTDEESKEEESTDSTDEKNTSDTSDDSSQVDTEDKNSQESINTAEKDQDEIDFFKPSNPDEEFDLVKESKFIQKEHKKTVPEGLEFNDNLKIIRIKDYIVEIAGDYPYIINEVVFFKNGEKGIVMKANKKIAFVALFEQTIGNPLTVGESIAPTGKEFAISIQEKFIGNIVTVDGLMHTNYLQTPGVVLTNDPELRPAFRLARPIYSRDFVNEPLITGLSSVDWAIPIGKGQRELILGDRKTGKTAMALNAILAQESTNVKTVYVAVGQKKTTILDFYQKVKDHGMLDQVIIVASTADQTSTKKWLAPYVGVTIAEYFQEKYGDDVLIIYDDLSKHADAYRELSLLLKSAPAREAYPGDIFYLHSKLLERAGKFNDEFGNGSITALPIIQTEAGDITSYIPTNVISITDGQVFTSKTLFNAGHRPAVDIPYSVSRVGSTAQTKSLADVSGGLKLLVSQYEEAKKMTRLSGEVSPENREIMDKGRVLMALLVQPEMDVLDYDTGALLLSLFKGKFLNFFRKTEEIIFIKKILNTYLLEDYLGKKIKSIIHDHEIEKEQYKLMVQEIILPMIKYHLLSEYSNLKRDENFMELYSEIRDDGRVFQNIRRSVEEI